MKIHFLNIVQCTTHRTAINFDKKKNQKKQKLIYNRESYYCFCAEHSFHFQTKSCECASVCARAIERVPIYSYMCRDL